MTILSLLQGDNIEPKRVTAQEMAGPCPICGGNDRFRVWPEKGRWWCRNCEKSGDEIEYLREFRGLSFADSCKFLGQESATNYRYQNAKKTPLIPLKKWEPKPDKTPGDTWQDKASAFISWASQQLLTNVSILQWLEQERGLTLETVKARRLGWNPTDIFRDREAWGLEPKLNDKGNPSKLFLPAGLVIPTFRGETLLHVRVRRHEPGEGQRYIFASGGSSGAMILGEDRKTMVIVESELDAILLSQDAGDICGAVALGNAQTRPDIYTNSILLSAEKILVSLDSDEAGAKEFWQWWKENFPNSERWPIIDGKDPTEAKKNGLLLRDWIFAGLPPTCAQARSLPELTEAQVSTELQSERESTIYLGKCEKCGNGDLWIPGTGRIVILCRQCFPPLPGEAEAPYQDHIFNDQTEYRSESSAIHIEAGGLSEDEAAAHASMAYPCTCGGKRFWISIFGPVICGACHLPAMPGLVARWIEIP